MTFAESLKKLRKEKNLSQGELADALNIAKSSISMYETGNRKPSFEMLEVFADFFNVSMDKLLGNTESKSAWHPSLTNKDERDIQKDLEAILNDMDKKSTIAMYNGGEKMDDYTREMMKLSLENALKMARLQAKEKFTPKKYRK